MKLSVSADGVVHLPIAKEVVPRVEEETNGAAEEAEESKEGRWGDDVHVDVDQDVDVCEDVDQDHDFHAYVDQHHDVNEDVDQMMMIFKVFGVELIVKIFFEGEREAGRGKDPPAEHGRPPWDGRLYHWSVQWESFHSGHYWFQFDQWTIYRGKSSKKDEGRIREFGIFQSFFYNNDWHRLKSSLKWLDIILESFPSRTSR